MIRPELSGSTTCHNAGAGVFSLIRPVWVPVTSTSSSAAKSLPCNGGLPSGPGLIARSKENFTSSAVNSPKPSWNWRPGFSSNSMTVSETCSMRLAADSSHSKLPGLKAINPCRTERRTLPSG